MGRIITLITDFGLTDGYVGTVKGVILSINPAATLVDIEHGVYPQDVFEAAFVLGTSYPYFPSSAIHLVVVDPGVGSQRAALAIRTPEGTFIGPDNGVLSWPIYEGIGVAQRSRARRIRIPPGGNVEAVRLSESKFWLRNPSRTFHGRDVFAPVAAYLSLGTPLQELGQVLPDVFILRVPAPRVRSAARIDGEILKVDHFGNLITNLGASDLSRLGRDVVFRVGGREIRGLSECYQEKPELKALIGSSGYVEIALRNGNAAQVLGFERGDPVVVMKNSGDGDNG